MNSAVSRCNAQALTGLLIGLIDVDGHNFPNLVLMNSTMEENLYRVYTLREMGYDPYVMIYNKPNAPAEVKRLQRWVNNKIIFRATKKFEEFEG